MQNRLNTVKDIAVTFGFLGLCGSAVYLGMRTTQSELELNQLRAQNQILSEKLMALNDAYGKIRSYTNTAMALASPAREVQERHGVDSAITPNAGLADSPLLQPLVFERHRNDVDRFMAEVELVDAMQQNTDLVARRLSGLADILKASPALMNAIPSIQPAEGSISSEFGFRLSPLEGKRSMHAGLDVGATIGTPIVATADGEVAFVGDFDDLGMTIVIDHGNKILTRYGHTSKIFAKKGQKVKRGQKIAAVGNSGSHTTGPHVHYEIWVGNAPVNPREFFFDLAVRPGEPGAPAAPAQAETAVEKLAKPPVVVKVSG